MNKYNNIFYIAIFIGIIIIISVSIYFYYIYPNYIMKKQVIAIANIIDDKIKGTIEFYEIINSDKVIVHVLLSGLKKNSIHGFHIHEAGDISDNCMSAGAHFNPYNKNHGGRDSKERHVGDLGNLKTDNNGNVDLQFTDNLIKLRGSKSNIIGRSIVIHEDIDDEGKGNAPDSLTTGHSGKRMVCAVIGYSKKMF